MKTAALENPNLAPSRNHVVADLAQLVKARLTLLVLLTTSVIRPSATPANARSTPPWRATAASNEACRSADPAGARRHRCARAGGGGRRRGSEAAQRRRFGLPDDPLVGGHDGVALGQADAHGERRGRVGPRSHLPIVRRRGEGVTDTGQLPG